MSIRVVVITGPVGVGKTTIVEHMSDLLEEQGVPHTGVDMDWLRFSYPRPSGDAFNVELGYRNLADLARNCLGAGSTRFVIADVVETRAQFQRYQEAIPDADVAIARLTADLACISKRIEQRAGGNADPWELARAAELMAIMDANAVVDVTIDTTARSPREVAEEVLRWLGW